MLQPPAADDVIAAALAEDLGVSSASLLGGTLGPELLERDVTSSAVIPADATFKGVVVARSACVVCGLPLAETAWTMLSRVVDDAVPVEVYPLVAEGTSVEAGTNVAEVEGPLRTILTAERTALNVLMTLSGIATEARAWQDEAGCELAVTDTRKTLPGLRALSKYAVEVGGAYNHRMGLYDQVLVKDNHMRAAGGTEAAIAAAREAHPGLEIEVEADTLEQAIEAARAGADIVMLDNFADEELASAVSAVRDASASADHAVLIEASGGITRDRLKTLAVAGVDRVSTSALTLAPPADFGLDEVN